MLRSKWQEMYQQKLITIDEAVSKIKSRDRVGFGMVAAEPAGLLGRLHTIGDKVENVSLFGALMIGNYDWVKDPRYKGIFKHEAWFYGDPARKAHASHQGATFVPVNLHRAGVDHYKVAPLHVLITTVSPMDRNGYFSLSLSAAFERWILESADRVIVEVNENTPRTFGDTLLHVSQVSWVVENHRPVLELPNLKPGPEEEAIAGHVAELVEDGATIQLGIGGIPNAVATYLKEKKGLGIHTEMIVDSMYELVECGAVTNANKSLDRYKTVGTFAAGTKRLYDWMHDNPAVEIRDGLYTNDPYVLARQPKMTSINTAISLDMTGQVCSESLGAVQYSGTGGQRDTHVGAWMSEGGKGILCLRSTAKNGTVSTIVPTLAPGSVVTMSRNDVDYIVTEYGVAHLRARPIHERAAALIRIAHPQFRAQLREEAEKLGWLP